MHTTVYTLHGHPDDKRQIHTHAPNWGKATEGLSFHLCGPVCVCDVCAVRADCRDAEQQQFSFASYMYHTGIARNGWSAQSREEFKNKTGQNGKWKKRRDFMCACVVLQTFETRRFGPLDGANSEQFIFRNPQHGVQFFNYFSGIRRSEIKNGLITIVMAT